MEFLILFKPVISVAFKLLITFIAVFVCPTVSAVTCVRSFTIYTGSVVITGCKVTLIDIYKEFQQYKSIKRYYFKCFFFSKRTYHITNNHLVYIDVKLSKRLEKNFTIFSV